MHIFISNQDDGNSTYIFINNETKGQIVKEHELHLSKHKIIYLIICKTY